MKESTARADGADGAEGQTGLERKLDPLFGPHMFESSSESVETSLRHRSCQTRCQVSNPQRKVQSSPATILSELRIPMSTRDMTFKSFNFLSGFICYFQCLISSEPHVC